VSVCRRVRSSAAADHLTSVTSLSLHSTYSIIDCRLTPPSEPNGCDGLASLAVKRHYLCAARILSNQITTSSGEVGLGVSASTLSNVISLRMQGMGIVVKYGHD